MSEPRQSVSGAYAKIESHEELCAERYRAIHDTLSEIKDDIGAGKRTTNKAVWLLITTLLGGVGWMAAQLWDGTQARISELPAAVSE